MLATDPATGVVVLASLEAAIRQKWADRRWYRRNGWLRWTDMDTRNSVELRALLRVRSTAKREIRRYR